MAAERDARTAFEEAVAVQPVGQGRYRAVIDRAWDGPAAPMLARFETRHLQEGHIEERGELWSSDGQLLAQSQQLALLLVPERID
jgi:hypothetical protein